MRGTAVPIGSRMTSPARPSYGVGSALTITSAAPLAAAIPHSEAAGSTVRVDPIARNRSHSRAACSARAKTPGSSRWPNRTVADFRIPPHRGQSGSSSPASTRASARSEEHTSELQSRRDLVCRLLLEKKKKNIKSNNNIKKKKKETKKNKN